MACNRVVPWYLLSNLYFNAMASVWCEQCGEIGVPVLYKYGRKLVGDCMTKSRLLRVWISESQFFIFCESCYVQVCRREFCLGWKSVWFDCQHP